MSFPDPRSRGASYTDADGPGLHGRGAPCYDPRPGRMEQASFWRTIPALLTAIAAVVTAVTGLLVALPKVGLLEREPPPASINGVWVANVTYSWGATTRSASRCSRTAACGGTATFLGTPRAVVSGALDSHTVSFAIRAEELLGSDRREFELTYRGTVVGGGLTFSSKTRAAIRQSSCRHARTSLTSAIRDS